MEVDPRGTLVGGATALRILVVNGELPPPDRDSGHLRLFRLLELLAREGHLVTVLCRAGFGQERYAAQLIKLGIEVFPLDLERLRALGAPVAGRSVDFRELLAQGRFDIALLSFFNVAEQYLPLIRRHSPLTQIVIDTVDVHHVRERRGAELSGDPVKLAGAERTRVREQAIYSAADALIAVSDQDAVALAELAPNVPRFVISNIHTPVGPTPGFEHRRGLVFVGGFPHAPNVDAALYFHSDIWPLVRTGLWDARLALVGSEPPGEVLALGGEDVAVTGWVPEVAPYLDAARVSIAPLRYGAGVKGKIGEALSRGLPVVTTSIGAEGMGLLDGEHALVADAPREFAAAVLRLHRDHQLWERISAAGRAHVERRLGIDAAREAITKMLEGVARVRFVIAADAPDLEAVIAGYTERFSPGDPASLVLTVPEAEPTAAQAAFEHAAAILARRGLDPEQIADIQIAPLDQDAIIPAGARRVAEDALGEDWMSLPTPAPARRRPKRTAAAAIVVHAVRDPRVLKAQIEALRRAELAEDVELVLVADGPAPELEPLVRCAGGLRVIRGTSALSRSQAWALGAQATDAEIVLALSPLALPEPGFAAPLVQAVRAGAVLAAPLVDGAAGLTVAVDGSLAPRTGAQDGPPDALPRDCLAARRELVAEGMPEFPRGEGHAEVQLAKWAAQLGPLAVAANASVNRLPAPDSTVIVCTRNRAEELPACVALLLRSGARDVVIVDNDCTDETAEVAGELARRSGGVVRVIFEPRGGLSHARNAGAAAATHDLLIYLDDDARPAPGWLHHLAWGLSRPGIVNAGGPICGLWPPERVPEWPGRELEPLFSILDLGDAEKLLVPPDAAYGANWAIRRDALREAGGFDPELGFGPELRLGGEELSVVWRLVQRSAGQALYVPGAAVGHRIAPERLEPRFAVGRAFGVGVEQPSLALTRGGGESERLLAMATQAASGLQRRIPLSGELSAGEAFERIALSSLTLYEQVQAAIALGTLAGSVALLGERQVAAGELTLSIDPEQVLRGIVRAPVSAPDRAVARAAAA